MNKIKTIVSVIIIVLIFGILAFPSTHSGSESKFSSNIFDNKHSIVPKSWQDNGIFSNYYDDAYKLLETLTIDEKIGQLLVVRYPKDNPSEIIEKYHIGGFTFYARDIIYKTKQEVQDMTNKVQQISKIPLLTAVDEEGGKIVRISSNPNLVSEKFKSPSELYEIGGFDEIKKDTINKSQILYNLGFNLNFAPVVDVSIDEKDYIYERTLKRPTKDVETYSKTVIEASKQTKVSYTLKHFPGYGNSKDTHNSMAINYESYETIKEQYLPPFKAGIDAGAEAVMISHNIMDGIDKDNAASLSPKIHDILKNDLNFTGIVITDDLAMGAVSELENVGTLAILAGNDLLITTNYETIFNDIKNSIENNIISEEAINHSVFRILAWKYYKNLM